MLRLHHLLLLVHLLHLLLLLRVLIIALLAAIHLLLCHGLLLLLLLLHISFGERYRIDLRGQTYLHLLEAIPSGSGRLFLLFDAERVGLHVCHREHRGGLVSGLVRNALLGLKGCDSTY